MIPMDKLAIWMKALVTTVVILSFTSLIGALLYAAFKNIDFPPGIKEVLCILVGVLAGSYKEITGYWVGSSHGSERKTELMNAKEE